MIKVLSTCTMIIFLTVGLLIFMPDNAASFDPSYYYDTTNIKKYVVDIIGNSESSGATMVYDEATGQYIEKPEIATIYDEATGSYTEEEIPYPAPQVETDYPPPANAYFPLLDTRNTAYAVNSNPDQSVITSTSNTPAPNPLGNYYGTHTGVDISARVDGNLYSAAYANQSEWDTVHAVKAGVVVAAKDTGTRGYGNHVMLGHKDGTYTLYAHFVPGTTQVRDGDTVMAGQVLGICGNSGNSQGKHLHFETRNTGSAMDLSKGVALYSAYWSTPVINNTYIQALNHAGNTGTTYQMSSIPSGEIPEDLWSTFGIS